MKTTLFKKKALLGLVCIVGMALSQTVYAVFYNNGPKWVRSTEQYQIRYFGEAYTRLGRGVARGIYKRNGRIVGQVTALVRVESNTTEDYQTTYVWDSIIPGRSQTTQFYYSWN